MFRTFAFIGFSATLLTVGQAQAAGAARCGAHQEVVVALAKSYKEAPKAVGLVNHERVVEIFVSAKGSWTILVTEAGGQACVLAAGQNFEEVPLNLQSLEPEA